MVYIKAVLQGGHVGSGRHHEMTRHLIVDNIIDVLKLSNTMPRVKKKKHARALIKCNQITREEYLKGIEQEKEDSYLKKKIRFLDK